MISGLCEIPLTFQAIIIWRDELNEGKILLRDIIDLEATYAGPDAKTAPERPVEEELPPPPPPVENRRIDPRERRARAAEAQRRRPGGEYGDVLSPEDFDTPAHRGGAGGGRRGCERLALGHGGRAQAARARDLRSHRQDLQVAAQAAGPGSRREDRAVAVAVAPLQETARGDHRGCEVPVAQPGPRRGAGRAALRHQQAADLARGQADAARRELSHPARRVPARISGRGARSQLAAPRRPAHQARLEGIRFIASAT